MNRQPPGRTFGSKRLSKPIGSHCWEGGQQGTGRTGPWGKWRASFHLSQPGRPPRSFRTLRGGAATFFFLRAAALLVAALFAIAATSPATAHALPPATATINLVGDRAYVAAAVPLEMVPRVDTNRDGLIDAREAEVSRAAFEEALLSRLWLRTASGNASFVFAFTPGDTEPSPYVVVMAGFQLRDSSGPLTVRTRLGSEALPVQFKVSRGKELENLTVSASDETHTFLTSGTYQTARDRKVFVVIVMLAGTLTILAVLLLLSGRR